MSDNVMALAEKDKRIVAITPAMPVGSKLTKFQQQLPDRFFDVGIAEQHAVTMAGGLLLTGCCLMSPSIRHLCSVPMTRFSMILTVRICMLFLVLIAQDSSVLMEKHTRGI